MDIDETVLNNYAFQNYLVLNNKTFDPVLWNQFVQDEKAIEIKGAFDFINYVWKMVELLCLTQTENKKIKNSNFK